MVTMKFNRLLNQQTVAICIGTFLEWGEFTLFGYLIDKIAAVFYPITLNHNLSIMAAFATFAVSYIARPLGGFIFGIIGDTIGRKPAMYYSLIGMGIATTTIGLIPAYADIGILSPLLLIIARIIQGISISSELCGGAIYLFENNPQTPYLSSSLNGIVAACGMFGGAIIAVIISLPYMPSWSWRIPFIIGGAACFWGLYIRSKLSESDIFLNIKLHDKLVAHPIRELIKHHLPAVIKTFCIAAFIGIYIYICNIWWISHVTQNNLVDKIDAKAYSTLGQGLMIIFTLTFASLTEYAKAGKSFTHTINNSGKTNLITNLIINKNKTKMIINGIGILRLGLFCSILAAYLLFMPIAWTAPYLIMAEIMYALGNGAVSATVFKYLSDIFPPSIRYTGQSFIWSIAVAIFGGSAPLVAQTLSRINIKYVIIYIASSAMLAFMITFWKNHVLSNLKLKVEYSNST